MQNRKILRQVRLSINKWTPEEEEEKHMEVEE